MTAPVTAIQVPAWRATRKFARTPKGLLIILFAILVPLAAIGSGWRVVAPGVVAAALVAMIIDAPMLRWREGAWSFPSGALLTGLIVAMVLSPHEPWYLAALTAAIGVASKYVVRGHSANVFNPAALALVITCVAFDTGQSWWGALPELPILVATALLAIGGYMAHRVNKLPSVLTFLGVYFALATFSAYVSDPAHVAELFREPDLHAALFFAFFMVTDPPTSPPKPRQQVVYAALTAVVSIAVFQFVGVVYYLLVGLLVANAWEGWRRHTLRQSRRA